MKLWLLRPINEHADGSPWSPWYDKAFGFVIRAESETKAREMATEEAGDEVGRFSGRKAPDAWRDPVLSSCVELAADGAPAVVMCDFRSA